MLSICVNVKNGERFLSKALASLSRFDDVVLLDNYSTDKTIEIAKQFTNVRVFQCEFQGMGKVRNIAASHAKNDWILFVDCDEVLEPELVDILLNYNFERGNIYNIYRKNYYDGVIVESSSWGNDWIKRLYNRNDTKFAENQVHDNFIDNLPNIKIHGGSMIHFPYEMVNQLIDKMQFYSTLYAKQHHGKKHPALWLIPFRAFFMFLKCYILKRGFMSGYEGLAISSYNAMGVFSKYIKLHELDYRKKIALAIDISSLDEIEKVAKMVNEQYLLPEMVFLCVKDNLLLNNISLALSSKFICGSKVVFIDDVSVDDLLMQEITSSPYIDSIIICDDFKQLVNKKFIYNIRRDLQKNRSSKVTILNN
ncbi:MAG: glycosyltransferase family 2 protein [Burkholderiales bacterium]|nr:glycosyltransferase family 2 protein [Burkholderiales bacterium]